MERGRAMTLEEYKKKMNENEEWAPGWEAIDECLKKLYPNQKERHFGTNMLERAIFGGNQYLDGYSIFESPKGYMHIITFGMSELYANDKSFGGEWSKWGYEMTMRLPVCEESDYMWAIDMMSNLARYTFELKRYFEPFQYISGHGQPLRQGSDSKLTGLLIVKDPELSEKVDTVHGTLEFLQLVGITQLELDAIIADKSQVQALVDLMKKDNPMFITDLARANNYLKY